MYKKTYPTPAEHTTGTNTCEYVILHHTGTAENTINGVLNGLYSRNDYASCHYCIDTNGDIYKIGNDTDILWHCGVSEWSGKTDLNKYSIGIEVIGPLSDGGFTDEQRASIKMLVKQLATKYGLSEDNILRHKDIAPSRKWDISDTLWNDHFEDYSEYIDSLFINIPKMSKYTEIMESELKRTGFEPLFNKHTGDNTLTEQEIKELIDIAFARYNERN